MHKAVTTAQKGFYYSFSFTNFFFGKAYLSLSDNG